MKLFHKILLFWGGEGFPKGKNGYDVNDHDDVKFMTIKER